MTFPGRLARVAVVVMLVTCVDGPTGPGSHAPAMLHLRVTLPANTPAAWTPSGETLHVALRRAGRVDPIVDTSVVVGDSLAATLTVPLAYAVERFVVVGEARYDGLVLFIGFEAVQLRAAGDTTITVAATYVGPGASAATYTLDARDSTLGPGDTASLVPVVRDSSGQLIPNVPVRYVAARPGVVTVAPNGMVTGHATATDTARVTGYLPMGLSSSLLLQLVGVVIPPGDAVTRTWLGNSAAWSDANNWDPPGVPGPADTVEIQATSNDPVLDATVTVARVRVLGGNLTLSGHALTVTEDFSTVGESSLGTFTMNQPDDTLRVLGSAIFHGGATTDLLSDGVLYVGGLFWQRNDGSNRASFQAGDNHRTVLNGSVAQQFRLEGDATFGHVEFANSSGIVGQLEETAAIQGTLRFTTATAFAGGDMVLEVGDSLIVPAGSSLFTARVRLFGALVVAGTFNPNTVEFAGDGQTIPAGPDYQHVIVSGTAQLTGPTGFAGSLFVGGEDANLTLGGHRLTVAGGVQIGGSSGNPVLGTLTMHSPADTLIAQADLIWGDGAGAGLLTAGVIRARGLVGSVATEETGAFEPSGSHRTVLEGSSPQMVALESTGSFNDLVLANAAGEISLGSPTSVIGTLIVTGALPQRVTSSTNILRATGVNVVGLTLDATTLTIGQGPIARFDSVTFQNQSLTESQLTVNHPGGAAPYTFTGLRFLTTPTSGAYISASDDAPFDGTVLTIAMVGSQPPNGASKTVTANGAIVTWDGPPPPTASFGEVVAGVTFSCGISTTNTAYCWGINTDGQLGDGTTTSRAVPTAVAGGLSFNGIVAGGQQTCAMTPESVVYCWGSNTYGQLGDGTTTDRLTPVAVAIPGGLNLANLTVGDQFACVITTGGQPYCWGRNSFGQLGDGTTTDRSTPVAVLNPGGLRFVSLKAGLNNVCGVTDGGAAYCWGSNSNGQLGDGTTTDRATPVAVAGGIVFNHVRPAAEHTCGIETGGQAYCWGWNNYGQLGDGTTTTRLTPVAVAGGFSFGAVYTGGNGFTCATDMTSKAYCWGLNNVGQLGDGAQTNRLTPVAVAGGLTLYVLSTGFAHVVGIGEGAAYGWGSNNFGQIGDGTTTLRTTPVLILAPTP